MSRPDMRDSFISGQPLYLLNSKAGAPTLAPLPSVAEAAQATGRVRLQVTGKPPTCKTLFEPCARARVPTESNAAAPPSSNCRRCRKWGIVRCRELISFAGQSELYAG